MTPTVLTTATVLARKKKSSNVAESKSPFYGSDSSIASSSSSLTHENLRHHNALHPSDHHIQIAGRDSLNIDIDGHSSSCHSTSPSSAQNSSHDLETPSGDFLEHSSFNPPSVDADADAKPSTSHVHFRPRVRIASGISRHRHSRQLSNSPLRLPCSPDRGRHLPFTTSGGSNSSSVSSSSLSSSISAPLRSRTDDESDKPGWGPLGQRVNLLARDARRKRDSGRRHKQDHERAVPCEHTPLIRPRPQIQSPITVGPEGRRQAEAWDSDWEENEVELEARISNEIDEVFGTMPRRLLNFQWWWWQLEPIVCCQCLAESDEE
ncbi:hypothetical protein DXG03_001950 [Asterophora parasitica]|uniref:Uncharacterized protein n=1 Tax=Asterophora parasitica TaxID=117018 RepID=A0A9P7KEW8_9AGAR|nr:hypothetical protein DXG03_001950 [Asterophora parasitica]